MGPMTMKVELGRDFCTIRLPTKSYRPMFNRLEVIVLTNKQTKTICRKDPRRSTTLRRWRIVQNIVYCENKRVKESERAREREWVTNFEYDVGAHGESVSDDWFFVGSLAVPAVQFNAPAAGQQRLPVDLHRRLARQLMTCHRHRFILNPFSKRTTSNRSSGSV